MPTHIISSFKNKFLCFIEASYGKNILLRSASCKEI